MAKMYLSEDEAAGKLGIGKAEFLKLAAEKNLRVYPDGPRKMYKAADIEALGGDQSEVELKPVAGDEVSLSAGERTGAPTKEDTVITSEGISIFDDEDLEVEAADPMAKTTIVPSVEDQVSLEGVGSGSGLLDLTRESDDTSLGAEVLEHIDVEAGSSGAPAIEAAPESLSEAELVTTVIEAPTVVEEVDPGAGAFSGLALAACLLMLALTAVTLAALQGLVPPFVLSMATNLPVILVAAAVVAIILAVVGYFMGKAVAQRAAALQRTR